MAARVFISYRRDEAAGIAGRLYDKLCAEFGRDAIFMDVDDMKPGQDFAVQLDEQVASCAILLALIGPNWAATIDSSAGPQANGAHDYVRSEIGSALKRGIPVVPVLLDGASVPSQDQLPDDLKALSRRHAVELRHSRFAADADTISDAVKAVIPAKGARWVPRVAAVAMLAVAAAAGAWQSGMLIPAVPRISSTSDGPASRAPVPEPAQASMRPAEAKLEKAAASAAPAPSTANEGEKKPAPPAVQWRAFTVQAKLDEPRADDPSKRGWLGVQIASIPRELAVQLGMTAAGWTVVNSVTPSGPGARAGILPGDIIIAAARKPTPAPRDLAAVVSAQTLGTTIPLSVWRLGAGADDFNAALERLAQGGNTLAMTEYGASFSNGRGVPQNFVTAKSWFERAAAKGDAAAMNKLAGLYAAGNGVSPDMTLARQWHEKAAAAGDPSSMHELGRLQLDGLAGLSSDAAKARIWFEKAASEGNSAAQFTLGRLHLTGRGGPKSEAEAIRLYRLASDQGMQQATYALAGMIESGTGTAKDEAEAARLFKSLADSGYAEAQAKIAHLLLTGRGVAQDEKEAARYNKLASDQGNSWATSNLAFQYTTGRGVPQDHKEAVRLNKIASEQGSSWATGNLAYQYAHGRGVEKDEVEAVRLYRIAVSKGDTTAHTGLGWMYESGRGGLSKDLNEAQRLYKIAADKGDATAKDRLAKLGASAAGAK